ncbi:MFS transporter [Hazenella coriacea]|uniref:MFS transporter n=1 Tax=Hazenella coriacea TaxID=1179467 RepID=A0A4R3L701_9BACL|nr:MFS transporter [Hazenella coriacea]TCS94805.1 MFS transporter [Hazenella coriacea]
MTKSFRFLWFGQSLANLGDSLYILAIITMIYRLTGSATLSALVPVINLSARLISGVLSPLLFQKFDLVHLLIFSQFGQTLGLALLSIWLMNFSSLVGLWFLLPLISFLDGWTVPARNSLVPRLVDEKILVKANGILSTTDQVLLLIGWSLGGILVVWLGSIPLLWLTVIFYLISSISLFFIKDPMQTIKSQTKPKQQKWQSIKEGWSILLTHPILKRLALMDVFEYLAGTVWAGAIVLAFVEKVLHQDESWWGWINGAYFAGTILGGLLIIHLSNQLEPHLFKALWIGSLSMAIFTLFFAWNTIPILSLILCVLMGPPYQAREIAERTLLQQHTSMEDMPKVFSAYSTLGYTLFGLGVLIAGWIADHVHVQWVYMGATVLSGISGIIALTLRKITQYKGNDPRIL